MQEGHLNKAHALVNEPHKYAKALDLVYVTDSRPGIERKRSGKGFRYFSSEGPVEKDDLARIKKLAIPPAWENVWICKLDNGHLQATGYDARRRKQYKYHSSWNHYRNETKFYRMIDFAGMLPNLRNQVKADIRKKELSQDKIIATIVSLMEKTLIRIGNDEYEKENGSYGLTTMKNRHVKIRGSMLQFSFRGKKGIHHKISLRSKRLASIIRQCRDLPGRELFSYLDEKGESQSVDSGLVNNYIRNATSNDFSAKDFRTWAGSLHALLALSRMEKPETEAVAKKNIDAAMDQVSQLLGNTKSVCKKYYVNPKLIDLYMVGKLDAYLTGLLKPAKSRRGGLTRAESVLIRILKKYL